MKTVKEVKEWLTKFPDDWEVGPEEPNGIWVCNPKDIQNTARSLTL